MTSEKQIKLGRQTALISFLLGTGIFGLYYLTSSSELLFVGYGFIVITGLLNLGVLVSILAKAKEEKVNRKELFMTCGLMLLNIPIMLLYCWVAIVLLDNMRITFTNSTEAVLTDINIIGCGGAHIDLLEIGQQKTVWVHITGDCSIFVVYLSNGQQKTEVIADYVTGSMGQKMTFNIGK